MRILLSHVLSVSLCLLLSGCQSPHGRRFFLKYDAVEDLLTYERDYGARIEQYLELAKEDLINSYKRNQYQMIQGDQPIAVVHPRKDLPLRELIATAHSEGKLNEQEKDRLLSECDGLYELWEKHWRSADRKARRLGLER